MPRVRTKNALADSLTRARNSRDLIRSFQNFRAFKYTLRNKLDRAIQLK